MTLTVENVKLYAETLVRQAAASGLVLDYSPESLATLDGLLSGSEPRYDEASEAERSLVIFYAGCYLGEVLIHDQDGHWQFAQSWAESQIVLLGEQGGVQVQPFAKLHRRLTEGEEGNHLLAYYHGLREHLENLRV